MRVFPVLSALVVVATAAAAKMAIVAELAEDGNFIVTGRVFCSYRIYDHHTGVECVAWIFDLLQRCGVRKKIFVFGTPSLRSTARS